MQVETYEEQEVATATPEQCEEALNLSLDLGLIGQQRFYEQHAADPDKPANPYRKMTAQEKWVYGIILQTKTKLDKYEDSAIPLRVLQVAAHAKTCFPDAEFQVWHPASADYKDPVLVARQGSEYGKHEWYIFARWGEVLEEFGVLMARAKEVHRAKLIQGLTKAKAEIDSHLASVDAVAEADALTGYTHSTTLYFH